MAFRFAWAADSSSYAPSPTRDIYKQPQLLWCGNLSRALVRAGAGVREERRRDNLQQFSFVRPYRLLPTLPFAINGIGSVVVPLPVEYQLELVLVKLPLVPVECGIRPCSIFLLPLSRENDTLPRM